MAIKVKASTLIETIVASLILTIAFLFFLTSVQHLYRAPHGGVRTTISLEADALALSLSLQRGQLIVGTNKFELPQGYSLTRQVSPHSEDLFVVRDIVTDSAGIVHDIRKYLSVKR